jgi:glycosyltransferase involved in cell wall biosynthesis
MKINFVTWYLKCNGGNRVIFEVANKLHERGHDVTITTSGGSYDWFPLKVKVNYIPTHFKYPSIGNMLTSAISFLKNMSKTDVNVATWCFTAYLVRMSGKGKPIYYCQHYEPLFFKNDFVKCLVRRTYDMDFNLVSNSSWLKNIILVNHNRDSYLVPNGIDTKIFRPQKVEKNRKVKRIVCQAKDYVVWKGTQDFLRAMKIVMNKRKDVELVFYGLKDLRTKPNIPYKFINFPSDEELVSLYNSADIVVCPSWYESFNMPPIEAMACGTPVITTRFGSEDYAVDYENCLVIHPMQPELLAEKILELLGDESLQRKFRNEGIKTAKRFTWNRTVDEFEKVLKKGLE